MGNFSEQKWGISDERRHYRDIGDYLSREDKLALVARANLDTVDRQAVTLSKVGDWLHNRDEDFAIWPTIGAGTRLRCESSRPTRRGGRATATPGFTTSTPT